MRGRKIFKHRRFSEVNVMHGRRQKKKIKRLTEVFEVWYALCEVVGYGGHIVVS